MQRRVLASISEQLRIDQREQRTSKRGEHRKLIIGPFDCRKRVSNRLDLFTHVKPAASNKQVRKPARFKRSNGRTSHVFGKTSKASKQQAHVSRLNGTLLRWIAPLGHGPAALAHKPLDERRNAVGLSLLDLPKNRLSVIGRRVGLGHRQRDHRRLSVNTGPVRRKWNITGLR